MLGASLHKKMIKNDKTSILFVAYERSCGGILTNTGIIAKLLER